MCLFEASWTRKPVKCSWAAMRREIIKLKIVHENEPSYGDAGLNALRSWVEFLKYFFGHKAALLL